MFLIWVIGNVGRGTTVREILMHWVWGDGI